MAMHESNILKFPGPKKAPTGDSNSPVTEKHQMPLDKLTPDQEKAIGLIISGVSFVFVGMKPTERGADFFTALHGDATDLRNAEDHLPAIISKLYVRKGIR